MTDAGDRPAPISDIKITDVEAIYLRLPEVKAQCDSGQDALIVRVSTDAGIVGYGEVDSNPMAAKGTIEGPFSHTAAAGLKHLLLGEDPFATEYLWHKMYRGNIYGGRRGVAIHAMSGVDLALWDIKGKALGLPVWKLLGGGFAEVKSGCYASSLFGATPKAETGELARAHPSTKGFSAVKFGWDTDGHRRQDRRISTLVRQARARASATDGDVMIDAGLVWDAQARPSDAREGLRRIRHLLARGAASRPTTTKATPSSPPPARVHIAAGEQESEPAVVPRPSWTSRQAWTSPKWTSRAAAASPRR